MEQTKTLASKVRINKIKGVDGTMVAMEEIEEMEDKDLENRDRFNMMTDDDDVDDDGEEGVDDEEDFFCQISDYMAATGHDVYDVSEESTNE